AAAEIVAVLRDRSARLGDTLRRAASFVRACGLLAPLLAAHAANGIVRVTGRAGPSTVERFPAALTDARRGRDESGRFAVSVRVPPPNWGVEPWAGAPAAPTIMRRLRAASDPAGVLAPGRYSA